MSDGANSIARACFGLKNKHIVPRVGVTGLEPAASCSQSRRSSQLSYAPTLCTMCEDSSRKCLICQACHKNASQGSNGIGSFFRKTGANDMMRAIDHEFTNEE